jgi:hypothetical protein
MIILVLESIAEREYDDDAKLQMGRVVGDV